MYSSTTSPPLLSGVYSKKYIEFCAGGFFFSLHFFLCPGLAFPHQCTPIYNDASGVPVEDSIAIQI
jgi:hypothetical protein